jgi:tetratricopeptide (TPR) repeat protein
MNNRPRLAQVLWNVSEGHQEQGDKSQARYFASRALSIYAGMDEAQITARAQARYGQMLVGQENFTLAEPQLIVALTTALNLPDALAAAEAAISLSLIYKHPGDTAKEQRFAEDGLHYAQQSGSSLSKGQAEARLADFYLSQNETAKAAEYFTQAIAALEQAQAYQPLGKVCFEYARTLNQVGRHSEAAGLFQKAFEYQSKR